MVNLKGVVVKEIKGQNKILLSTEAGLVDVVFKNPLELNNVKKLSLINVYREKSFLKSFYEVREDSLISYYPGFLVEAEEIDVDIFETLFALFTGSALKASYEKEIFLAIRDIKTSEQFKYLKERLPKDVKAKFSFRPYVFNTTYGFFVKDALSFGKFPVVFEGNDTKGVIQALSTNQDQYLVMSSTGTFDKRTITAPNRKKIVDKRNQFVFAIYHFFDFLEKFLNEENPHYKNCRFLLDEKESLASYILRFLKDLRNTRKFVKKVLEASNESIEGLKLYNQKIEGYEVEANIKDNEFNLKKDAPVVILEKPPFSMKVFGVVKEVDFKTIKILTDYNTASADSVVPLKTMERSIKGIVKLKEKQSLLKDFLIHSAPLPPLPSLDYTPKELISANPIFAIIKGDFGTGKKHLIGEFIRDFPSKKVIIYSKNVYASLYEVFGNLVCNDINSITDYYDDIFYFDKEILYEDLLNLASFTENLIVFTYPTTSVPFEEEVKNTNLRLLNEVFGFDKSIYNFVSKFFKLSASSKLELNELKIVNKNNISKEFIPIINPEKVVQFVRILGSTTFNKNKFNEQEGEFTVELISNFLKSGVERSSLEVIVPYERQKAYINELLKEAHIDDVAVKEVFEAVQKPVVIINFVDEGDLPPVFKDNFNLSFAITRGRNKVVLVGSPRIEKLLLH